MKTLLQTSKAITMDESINWKEIYDHLLPRVYHFFCYKTGDSLIAEELSALCFEKAWTHRENYRKNLNNFEAWVFGIAQKVAADHFRKRRHEVGLEAVPPELARQHVEADVEQRLDFERLASLMPCLSERERLLIALKYGAELNNRQIARQTWLSESNVGTILSRAVAKLRAEWEK
jgi:RNA polymerase sigma-70 factor (ECF subfamily)